MPEESPDLWTQILQLLSQLVTPDWNALVLLLPFAMLALAVVIVLPLVRAWRRAEALNRPRLPPRRPPAPPPGVHMPGPSPWPFIAPIGGALVLVALVFPSPGLPVHPILFAAGLGVSAIAVGGWLWDAGREWRRAETGRAHSVEAVAAGQGALRSGAGVPRLGSGWEAVELPPGVHLPGPSPWPFFIALAGAVLLLGLIFGPMLILGGIVMALLAVAGWYRDAGREYRQVDQGHIPEAATHDPERAFPTSLVKVYAAIALFAVALTVAPAIIGSLPGNAGGGGTSSPGGASPDPDPEIAADSVLSFTSDRLVVPADTPIELTFDNRQAGVPHNVHILQGTGEPVFEGEDVTGPATVTYHVPPLAAGEYRFICSIHPPMTGTLVAE